jgi:hypothetical protein
MGFRQGRFNQRPFGTGEIDFVAQRVTAKLPPSRRGPDRAYRLGFSTLLEYACPDHPTRFRTGSKALLAVILEAPQFELVGASVYYLNELEFNQRIEPRRIMLQRYMYLDLTEHGFAAFVRTYRTHVFDYIPMIPSVT